jgi:acetyltransferase-like isoleucine patch superfamily enzyme
MSASRKSDDRLRPAVVDPGPEEAAAPGADALHRGHPSVDEVEIAHGRYTEIRYRAFDRTRLQNILFSLTGWISLPVVLPMVWLVKLGPDVLFRTFSELLSLIPTFIGYRPRYEFYRRVLTRCGEDVLIAFGAVFYYRQIRIGNRVLIQRNVAVHHCDIGDDVMVAEGTVLLSGSKYHGFSRTDIPMTMQPGLLKRIRLGSDVFVGAQCVVMEDVETGSVVAAGTVVTKPVESYTVVAGNPARLVRRRLPESSEGG